MRLLFAIKGLVIAGGGAERVFVEVVNALSARGHEIHVATFDHPDQELFYDVAPDIRIHLFGAGEPGVSTPRSNIPKIMRRIRKLAADIQPDAAAAFMHSTYVPVAAGLIGSGVPMILSEHTAGAHFAGRPLEKALTRLVQKLSFAKTVVSPIIKSEHAPAFHRNLIVLPNPVDMNAFAPAREIAPDKVILCVGGLRVEKDQESLIAAFEQIADRHPGWKLRLVGDGTTRPQIEAQIARSPVAGRIQLPGVLKDVPAEYAKAAIVAMPSRYEALPMVAIEAMASGRPVIGFSDCAGAAALIRNDVNGLLIDPANGRVTALAEALETLITDEDLRRSLSRQAPDTVQSYSLDAVVDRWETLLQAAASNNRNAVQQMADETGSV